MMTRVTTGSRLHFGLLSVPAKAAAGARQFGGVGLMLQEPEVSVTVEPAAAWSASGPSAERALGFAQRFMEGLPEKERFRLTVERCPPEHVGLGVGTQLGLAVGQALARQQGRHDNAVQIAHRVGRGLRSSLGIHGFAQGGFLVEAGKHAPAEIGPLVCRHAFPADWRVLLLSPAGLHGTSGVREREAFERVVVADPAVSDALCRLALLGMLPALLDQDLAAFGAALHEYNRRAGEWFAAWQGGPYAQPRTAELIAALRKLGIAGVGQSSWGPTVFAIADSDRLTYARQKLIEEKQCSANETMIVTAANHGATVECVNV